MNTKEALRKLVLCVARSSLTWEHRGDVADEMFYYLRLVGVDPIEQLPSREDDEYSDALEDLGAVDTLDFLREVFDRKGGP